MYLKLTLLPQIKAAFIARRTYSYCLRAKLYRNIFFALSSICVLLCEMHLSCGSNTFYQRHNYTIITNRAICRIFTGGCLSKPDFNHSLPVVAICSFLLPFFQQQFTLEVVPTITQRLETIVVESLSHIISVMARP